MARAATMSLPGAARSGLRALSPSRGPRLEKSLSWSVLVTLPIERAASAAAGVPIEPSWPKLPAAITNSVPCSLLIRLTASDIGSVPSVGQPPRLMFTTLALAPVAAHSMPAMIPSNVPEPESSSTLPTASFASGATPLYLPFDAAPEPSAIDATCVPWPYLSSTVPVGVKFLVAPIRAGEVRVVGVVAGVQHGDVTPLPV